MQFSPFSNKQLKVMTWWMEKSPVHDKEGIIGDGSIRSGKTVSFGISFFLWAMSGWAEEQNFAMCGKTINSFRRNVWSWLKSLLVLRGYSIDESRDENKITISYGAIRNYFYIFGGKDERSQDLIQGITLAGILFDEVALMPESFVNQATGRCSVTGSKFWFNCNPDNPKHWFKENWIDKADSKNLLYLHFTMDDNLSLSEDIKERYKSLYIGVFYKRFILGLWVMAEGAIYDNFDDEENTYDKPLSPYKIEQCNIYLGTDYGTTNPLACLLAYDDGDTVWIDDEYYFNSRAEGYQKTDEQYCDDLEKWIGNREPEMNIIDPSAASFIVAWRNRGHRVREADNEVLDGIRQVSTMIGARKIKINKRCVNLLKELPGYVWDDTSVNGKEKPLKFADHACVSGDTLIKTTQGDIPIKELVEKTGYVYGQKGITKFQLVSCTGEREVFRFTTDHNRVIIATVDHPVLTPKGWQPIMKATQLFCGDKIVKKEHLGRQKVYNMLTEDHTYKLSNGIICHNCDALRYIIKTKVNPRRMTQ